MAMAGTRLDRFLRLAAALIAGILLINGTTRALSHLNDLSGINHIAGIWMALAQYLNEGIFYPPLYDNGYYAGTRYMPVVFCLIALLGRLLGNYLLASKTVALLAVIGLIAATWAIVWRITKRWPEALSLAAVVVAFPEGLRAALLPHADALSVLLSIAGLLAVVKTPRFNLLGSAAILFGLAFATKFSSIAAPAAAVAFLLGKRDWKAAGIVAVVTGTLAIATLVVLQMASEGRFGQNFQALGGGSMNLASIRNGPARFLAAVQISSSIGFVAPFVLPLGLLTMAQNWRSGGLTLWDWYFLMAMAATLLIFTSPGTDINHLLEVEVAAICVVAQRFAPLTETTATMPRSMTLARLVVLAALGAGGLSFLRDQDEAVTFAALVEQLPPNPHLLTEDATPVVLLGRRPVVMDAFAFRILAERHLIDDEELVRRIERKEFNALIMLRRVDDPAERLTQFHFGPNVNEAMRRAYVFQQQVGQYYIHRPAGADGADRADAEKR
jgi:hypothetical protein